MANTWIASDLHLGHANIIKFVKPDGTPIRPGFTQEPTRALTTFKDIEHHDEALIRRWNDRVAPEDTAWILGDIGGPLEKIKRLNGKKYLILGNHDDIHEAKWREVTLKDGSTHRYRANPLDEIFHRVLSWRVWRDEFEHPTVFCHYPLHADDMKPAVRRICVHGHIHEKIIMRGSAPDPWYINVCVEHTNHAPISFDDLRKTISRRVRMLKDMREIV